MADDNLRILIMASLDLTKSESSIKQDLEKLSKNIGSLKLNVDLDTNSIQKFSASMNNLSNEQLKVNKVLDQTSKLSGEAYGDLQARVKEIKNSVDEYAKVQIQTYKNTNNLKSATIEYRNELGLLVREQMAWTSFVNKNKDTGEYQRNKVFQTTGFTFVDNMAKTKSDQENALLAEQTKNYKDITHELGIIQGLKVKLAQLTDQDSALAKIIKEQLQSHETILSEIEQRKVKINGLEEQDAVNEEQATSVARTRLELEEKLAIAIQKQQEKLSQVANAPMSGQRYLGDKVSSNFNLDGANTSSFKSLAQEVAGSDAEFTRIIPKIDKTLGDITQLNVRVKEGGQYWHNYAVTVIGTTGEVYKLDQGLSDVARRQLSLGAKIKEMSVSIPLWFSGMTVFMGLIHGIEDFAKTITDVDVKMAGYVQTNETVLNSQQKIDDETHKFILTAHELGASIDQVLESARLYGRMYKDVGVVQELVRQSTKLSTVDLVDLGDATKGMESILSQYHIQLKNVNDAQVIGNNLLDKFSNVAHQSAIPARDLIAAYERMGSVAYQTGVSVDFMNGLLASGFRNTALSGENLGNMWKTVLGNLHSDKAVAELDRLGVKTKEVVNGVQQWKSAEDIILDLSTKVIGKNEDLTKTYEDIARGVYQYQKLAASLDVGSIIQAEAASVNSAGKTTEYLTTQMDTIDKKAKQVKASFVELFTTAGDDGLRSTIKSLLDVTDQFLLGLSRVPMSTYEVSGALAALAVGYIALNKPIRTVIEAIQVVTGLKSANTVATAANTVATTANTVATDVNIVSSKGSVIATVQKTGALEGATVATATLTAAEATETVTLAAATAGISLVVAALAALIFTSGSATKAQEDLTLKRESEISSLEQQYTQIEKQIEVVPKWINVYFALNKAIDSGTLSKQEQAKATSDLDKVSKALIDTVGQDGLAQIQAAKNTDDATKIIIESLNKRRIAAKQDIVDRLTLDSNDLHSQNFETLRRRNTANQKLDELKKQDWTDRLDGDLLGLGQKAAIKEQQQIVDQANADLKSIGDKIAETENRKADINVELANLSLLSGDSNKTPGQDEAALKKNFDEQMSAFRHNVNMQTKGYTDAAGQLDKLKAIKAQFAGKLQDTDLYGIDEEMHRAQNDIALNAKGFPSENSLQNAQLSNETLANSIQHQDITKGQIKAINEQYDVTKELNAELDKKIKNEEKEKNYGKAIEDTNKYIKDQKDLINQIGNQDITDSANGKIHTIAENMRKELSSSLNAQKYGITKSILDSWFDVNGQQSSEFTQYMENIANKADSIVNGNSSQENKKVQLDNLKLQQQYAQNLFDTMLKLKQAYKDNQDQVDTINASIDAASSKLVDDSIGGLSKTIDPYTQKIKDLKTAMDSLKTDPAGKVADQNSIIDTYQQEQQQILANIQALKDLSSTLDVNSDAWNKAQDEIKKYQDQSAQVEADAYAVKQKIAQDTVDLMKKAYQAEKQAQLDALDTEKKAFDDATQAKIDSIDRLRAVQDYQSTLSKDQEKAQQIQNQINAYSLDSSAEAKSKVLDLKQQLADQQEKITKEQQDYSDKLVKQDLQDKQKAYDQDIQNQKDATTTKYDNLINDDQKWLTVETDIINGHVQGIQTEMKGLIDGLGTYANSGMDKAKNNANQLLTLVSQVKAASASLSGYSATVNSPTAQSNTSITNSLNTTGTATNQDDMSWQDKLKRAATDNAYAISEILRAKSVYNADTAIGDTAGAEAAHKYADQIRTANPRVGSNPLYMNTGGYTGDGEGLAYLHSKEIVLNQVDTSNLLKAVDWVRDITSKIKLPDFSKIMPKMATGSGGDVNIQLHIGQITGDQKGADSVINMLANRLKNVGVNINQYNR